jgi:hypothetical protein
MWDIRRLCKLVVPFTLAVLGLFAGRALLTRAQAQAPTAAIRYVDDSVNDGLAAHWKFDEAGATTAVEFIVGANGVLTNGAIISSGPIPPGLHFFDMGVLNLDGVDDRVDIADNAALNLATNFSLAAWVKRSSSGSYDAIYDSGEQANQWWIFIADATKNNLLGFGERGIAEIYSTQQITDTNWHHIAVVKNGDAGNNVSFYVDGVARGSGAAGAVTVPSGPKQIGALLDSVFTANLGGSLDDVRLYNRALTAAEVLRLAQGEGCITDGTSWSSAFRELQCGLAAATTGDQIWIGQGVYRPGVSTSLSFNLKNGVNLYGGFLGLSPGGGETALTQRPAFNPNAPLTVLSGDVLGNDLPATFGNYKTILYGCW